jgi:hypothetical protein
MNLFEKYYTIESNNPPYPFYHEGDDLEKYFINFYFKNKQEFDKTGYEFIPVRWTIIYNESGHLIPQLQQDLYSLDSNKKYFTISQHDDAPHQVLPPNTLNFAAGGNMSNTIPIPLICSPIKKQLKNEKDIYCSFVGSVSQNLGGFSTIAHQIRMRMLETLVENSNYILKPKYWSHEINENRQELFLNLTSRSKFTLCPRGYGASSFRLYEAMQLNSIPVYIYYKQPYLPFSEKIKWDEICVLIEHEDTFNLDEKLKNITEDTQKQMLLKINQVYKEYFTLEKMCENILKKLQNYV